MILDRSSRRRIAEFGGDEIGNRVVAIFDRSRRDRRLLGYRLGNLGSAETEIEIMGRKGDRLALGWLVVDRWLRRTRKLRRRGDDGLGARRFSPGHLDARRVRPVGLCLGCFGNRTGRRHEGRHGIGCLRALDHRLGALCDGLGDNRIVDARRSRARLHDRLLANGLSRLFGGTAKPILPIHQRRRMQAIGRLGRRAEIEAELFVG